MNVKEIYKLAIDMGIKADFRSKEKIEKKLKREKEKYGELSKDKKELFDLERMTNPYLDSRIHFAGGSKVVKRVMTGIDIDTSELMMSRYLSNHESKPIDLVIA